MLLDGKLDSALRYLAATNNLIDRSSVDLYKHPNFKTLFRDPHAANYDGWNATLRTSSRL